MKILRRILHLNPQLASSDIHCLRRYSTPTKRICIIGGGTAGFYAAQYLAGHLDNCSVDIVEKLPVPFGLVRYGVAPDHPEVKNVINTFTKTAHLKNVHFMGNLTLGTDVKLRELQDRYHCVLLAYGAERDRRLGLPNEDQLKNVISAREFVAYYNGLPGADTLNPDLSGRTVSIIGQGNVAIDVARILLSPIDQLARTDITDYALDALRRSNVERVNVIGRRGPLQAAFTIKELREMLKLPNCKTIWRLEDFLGIPEKVAALPRPRKRITELMLDSLSKQTAQGQSNGRIFAPIFLRSPTSVEEATVAGGSMNLHVAVNQLTDDNKARATDALETIPSDLILRSIGYKSHSYDEDLNFDSGSGVVRSIDGRLLRKDSSSDVEAGLYAAGWLSTGPTGVILTTMNDAFKTAQQICDDFKHDRVPDSGLAKPGLNEDGRLIGKRIVTWQAWERIDEAEQMAGQKNGKPREKVINIEQMLEIAKV